MKKPKKLSDAITAIAEINSRGFWKTDTKEMLTPVPNISGQAPGIARTHAYESDEISDKLKFTDGEFELILYCAKKFSQLALYVHESPFGFHPIFTLLYYKAPLIPTWNGEKEHEHIVKWKNSRNFSNMPAAYSADGEEGAGKFLEELYSKKNQEKLEMFSLPIRKIERYWY